MHLLRIPTLLLSLAFFVAPVVAAIPADDTPPGEVRIYKNSGGKPRELEIYFPANHDPARRRVPGVILFHGGGWGGGDLSQFRAACAHFAKRGLVAATANYRMLTKTEAAALPERTQRKRVCITDAKSAIRWMKKHAAELGIDPARIITGGGSAGGHVSVLATLNPGLNDPADPDGIDTAVVAYLLFNPAFTAADAVDPEVDVLRHADQHFAPALAMFGTKDSWKRGWDDFQRAIEARGNTTTKLLLAEGQAHAFFNRGVWKDICIAAADRFLVRQGLLRGDSGIAAPASGEKLISAPEFVDIFNGTDLSGWDGKPGCWEVRDGEIWCTGKAKEKNWLIWRGGQPGDFVLRMEFRWDQGNSGVQVRSDDLGDWMVFGYQVEVAKRDVMGLWHHSLLPKEHPKKQQRHLMATAGQAVVLAKNGRKTTTQKGDPDVVKTRFNEHAWNNLEIVAQGDTLTQLINGVEFSKVTDRDEEMSRRRGFIALQDHGKGCVVAFRKIQLKLMP